MSEVRADVSRRPLRAAVVVEYPGMPAEPNGSWLCDPAGSVLVELPAVRSFDAVGRLVLAGLGSRVGLPVDRIEDFQLALEAVFQEPASRDTLTMEIIPSGEDLRVRIGPLAAVDAERTESSA